MTPRYLFIVGCPRSGTGALWHVLVSHPRIVLGFERYLRRYVTPAFLDRSLFEEEGFFNIESGDTVYTTMTRSVFVEMRMRYEDALYRGDKIPMLFRKLPELDKAFGDDLRVVMIVRDVYAVAESWQRRRDDPNDTLWPDLGVREAVETWNDAITVARSLHDPRFLVVSCEELFEQQQGLDALFGFLELHVVPAVRAAHGEGVRRFADGRGRPSTPSDEQRRFISENAVSVTFPSIG